MSSAMAPIADQPVEPTTAAIAPKAPIGATHITIMRMRNTTPWISVRPRSSGAPAGPICCRAKPTSRAMNRVGSTGREPGMMSSRNWTVPSTAAVGLFGS